MKTMLRRYWVGIWWVLSAGIIFGLGCLARLIVRDPPFTDWHYIAGMAVAMPSALLPLFLYVLRKGRSENTLH